MKAIELTDTKNNNQISNISTSNEKEINSKPFPFFSLFILSIASFTSSIALTSLLPYVALMVYDFGLVTDVDHAGYYSGYIAAAMMTGRLVSSYFWGSMGDKIGRRPIVCMCCLSIASMSILFGFSTSMPMALAARLALGLTNPMVGLVKTIVSELCDSKQEAFGMSVSTGGYSLGMLIGPALGGLLSRPCPKYCSNSSIFSSFPYLLPNLIVGVLGIISFTLVYIFLPETLTKASNSEPIDKVEEDMSTSQQNELNTNTPITATVKISEYQKLLEIFQMPGVMSSFTVYFISSIAAMVYDEVLPLWMLTTIENGGMGYSNEGVGKILMYMSFPMLVFAFVGYPTLSKFLNAVNCFKFGQTLSIIGTLSICFVPIVLSENYRQNHNKAEFSLTLLCMVLLIALVKVGNSLAFTAIAILINGTVESSRKGTINGMAMTIGSSARAVGPIIGAILYAFSINRLLYAIAAYVVPLTTKEMRENGENGCPSLQCFSRVIDKILCCVVNLDSPIDYRIVKNELSSSSDFNDDDTNQNDLDIEMDDLRSNHGLLSSSENDVKA